MRKYLKVAVAAVLAITCSSLAWSVDEVEVGELSYLDQQYMAGQRARLNELASRHVGTQFRGATEHDLRLLQRLLDDEVVTSDQTLELQAMGIVLGDLLAQELAMHWVVYQDKLGRSRALRYRTTDHYLFPVTMISRRWEGGAYTPVADIYRKAVDTIRPAVPALPFQ